MEHWISRRSAVYGMKGMCASSQVLASSIGVKILERGGSAADAAVAMAAALNVTEPCSTGIGGDAFALYFEAATKKVHCLSGNGCSAEGFNLDKLRSLGIAHDLRPLDPHSGLCVTVPGAAMLWDDIVKSFGCLPLSEVLAPAIELAEKGFPVHQVTAQAWSAGFLQGDEAFRVFRPNNQPISAGQVITNKDLAETFRTVGKLGAKEGFYSGRIASAIVAAAQQHGGLLELSDLAAHATVTSPAISTVYKGLRIYQTPPPSHGLAVLLAMNIIQEYDAMHASDVDQPRSIRSEPLRQRNGIENTHICIESMRRAFADALQYIGDPAHASIPLEQLLSADYSRQRAKEIDPLTATPVLPGALSGQWQAYNESLRAFSHGETVFFCVVDEQGNACSFINSNYQHFGTGIVPLGTGFSLQNRGFNFSLVPGHNNAAAGRKRPYHTIIPGLATFESDGSLYAVFGNMGGFMQPMGHVQLLRGLVDFGLDPQLACDAPRWYLTRAGKTQSSADLFASEVQLEDGYPNPPRRGTAGAGQSEGEEAGDEDIRVALRARGHFVHEALVCGAARAMFGKAQVIVRDPLRGTVVGGSDPRGDGCAIPQV